MTAGKIERVDGKPIASPHNTMAVALSLAKAGWPVFPVNLVPVAKTDEDGNVTHTTDKRPLIRWLEGASTDLEEVATWWGGQFAGAWVGVHAARAGIVTVDLDLPKGDDPDAPDGRENLRAGGYELPPTPIKYKTRSGGRHRIYAAPQGRTLSIGRNHPVPLVDIRAGNGLMVYYGPPLTGPVDLPPAPEWALIDGTVKAREADGDAAIWLRRALPGTPPKGSELRKLVKRTDWAALTHDPMLEAVTTIIKSGTVPGAATVFAEARAAYVKGRPDRERDWDNAAAGSIGRLGLPPLTLELTKAERKHIAQRNTPAAIDEAKTKRKADYRIAIHNARAAEVGKRVLEDGPLSVELAEAMTDHWAWTKGRGLMRYTGKVWVEAETHALVEEVRQRLDDIEVGEHEIAVRRQDNKAIDKARTLLSRNRARAVSDLVLGRLALNDKRFDAHPDLLNVQNGVVDLRTSKLLPHDPSLYLTRIALAEYDPKADMKLWLKALTALPPRTADWLKVRFGQAATGHTPDDDKLLLFQANGENGKSTIFAGVLGVLGDSLEGGYAVTVPDRLLTADPGDHPTTLMMLMGARLAVFEELPEGRNLNVKRLKDTVGTPKVTARRMRQDDVTFKATHALMGDTNYQAIVAETDRGTWRRLALVRFPYTFVKSKSEIEHDNDRLGDPRVRRHFENAADPGVLRWLVEGARTWYDNGELMPKDPKSVKRDTKAWRLDADPVLGYLAERIVTDPDSAITCDDLASDFNEHLERRGHRPWSAQTINSRFDGHEGMSGVVRKQVKFGRIRPSRPPFTTKPIPASTKAWVGIRFKAEGAPVVPMSAEVAELEKRMHS